MAAISGSIELYRVSDSTGNNGFSNQIGMDLIKKTLADATDFTWKALQLNTPAERKTIPTISLFIENSDGVAFADNDEIHFNAGYLERYSSHDDEARREFVGVIYHEMVHVWQWNGGGRTPEGLIEGVADYVRLKAGYGPSHWVEAGEGQRWDQGYAVTARFLDYCDHLREGFVAELNKKMRSHYDEGFFFDLLGKTVDQLWSDYKAKYQV
ncbi:unnamed protein product [Linum trigynum]|uniref:Plant basic secretory protein (BSP) family protein n=1 Tax=Linum trigynum TaxID=586398 RepID=A0AAV2ESE2_9ROSI